MLNSSCWRVGKDGEGVVPNRDLNGMLELSLQAMIVPAGSKEKGRPEGLPPQSEACATYAVRMVSDLSPEMAACAAARRAIGTR